MAATRGDHVIHSPDATAEEQSVQRDRETSTCKALGLFCFCIICAVVAACVGLLVAFVSLYKPAEYSASIAGIDGPDAVTQRSVSVTGGSGSLAVPALFNLTVHATNPSKIGRECVCGGSTASVWYNGTLIAEGDVPAFCVERRGEQAVVASLRGVAVDAPLTWLPAPGEMQRSGAVVDVVIWLTKSNSTMQLDCSGMKVGGVLPLCS